ncbi:hypothetical protein ACPCSE_29225 [Streptomyces cellulosae]
MDSVFVSLDDLFRELRSVKADTVNVSAALLSPGHVIASGKLDRHVVTGPARPDFISQTLTYPVRHLHGGHTVKYVVGDTATVSVYAARLAAKDVAGVPEVPLCGVPDAPAVGDRIVCQPYIAHAFGVMAARRFDGERWQTLPPGLGKPVRTSVMREEVAPPAVGSLTGWYVYLPAWQRPYLYSDGRPVPGRMAHELTEGDVMLIPGGGRFVIDGISLHADGYTFTLFVEEPSRHAWQHLFWANDRGSRVQHHDSGQRGYMYPTEWRPEEVRPAAALETTA